MMRVG